MELSIKVPHGADRAAVLGTADRHLKLIREALGVRMISRDGNVRLLGDRGSVLAARDVLRELAKAAEAGNNLTRQHVHDLIGKALDSATDGQSRIDDGEDENLTGPAWQDTLHVFAGGRPIAAKTPNQALYLQAIRDHDVVFGIGPAGTGKTYLAVAAAVHLLKAGRAKRIVLCRPAVEAGEKLGFLPGDMQAKVNPYLRPLFDALSDMMDFNTLGRFMSTDVVEVVPLAFMRGRTLNRSVIILDEAQNTSPSQMKMFLTRMGQGSKVIVTGDPSQTDLPESSASGLADALRVLRKVKGVALCGFDQSDIVRHELVQRIVEAYGKDDERAKAFATHRADRHVHNGKGNAGGSGDEGGAGGAGGRGGAQFAQGPRTPTYTDSDFSADSSSRRTGLPKSVDQ